MELLNEEMRLGNYQYRLRWLQLTKAKPGSVAGLKKVPSANMTSLGLSDLRITATYRLGLTFSCDTFAVG